MASRLSKPLQTSTTAPVTAKGLKAQEATRNKRKLQHEAKEAQRAPDEKLMSLDVSGRAKKLYSIAWLQKMGFAMRIFTEFTEFKLFAQEGDANHGAEYFKPNGPLPDQDLCRRVLSYYADSTSGKVASSSWKPSQTITNTNLAVSTVKGTAWALVAAINYYNREGIDHAFRSELERWIDGKLSPQMDLVRHVKPKPVTYPQDIEVLVRSIWSFESVAGIKCHGARLSLTTVLNVLADSGSRIGELLAGKKSDIGTGSYLEWQNVDFYIFPKVNGQVNLLVSVTSKWLKKYSMNPSEWKGFNAVLLAPNRVFQDSCRLLLELALQGRHLQDFQHWEEVVTCQPGPDGYLMQIKPTSRSLPVFSKGMFYGRVGQDDIPLEYGDLLNLTQYITALAGLPDKFQWHSLRRGAAYAFNKHCDPDTARRLLAQRPGSSAFHAYISKMPTVDTQALVRSLPTNDLTKMSSVSLGRVDQAPTGPSTAAMEELMKDKTYIELMEAADKWERTWASAKLEHGSRAKAALAAPDVVRARDSAYGFKQRYLTSFLEKRYRAEYESFIISATTAKPHRSDAEGSAQPETPEVAWATVDDTCTSGASTDIETSSSFLIETLGHLSPSQAALITDEMEQLRERANSGQSMQAIDPYDDSVSDVLQKMTSIQYREHRVFRDELDAMVGRAGRMYTNVAHFSPKYVSLREIYNSITQDEDTTYEEVNEIIHSIKSSEFHMHAIPHHWRQGPVYRAFCESHKGVHPQVAYFQYRSYKADQIRLEADRRWKTYLDQFCLVKSCDVVALTTSSKRPMTLRLKPNSTSPMICGKEFSTPAELQKHWTRHIRTNALGAYVCSRTPCLVSFNNKQDFADHCLTMHNFYWMKAACGLYTFCRYCEEYIWEALHTSRRIQHFETHLQEALDNVKTYGYDGVYGHSEDMKKPCARQYIQMQCPFCLHNSTLNAEERIAHPYWYTRDHSSMSNHLSTHLEYMTDDEKIYCPASAKAGADPSFCSFPRKMNRQELSDHLRVHLKPSPSAKCKATTHKRMRLRTVKVLHESDDENSATAGPVEGNPGIDCDSSNSRTALLTRPANISVASPRSSGPQQAKLDSEIDVSMIDPDLL